MLLLPRRSLLAIAAVVDIAVHGRSRPVAAKSLAARHDLPPRHLETLLQTLVHVNILHGVRGPLGGYQLGRERRLISVSEIIRAADERFHSDDDGSGQESRLIGKVIGPLIESAGKEFLDKMEHVSVHDLCVRAGREGVFKGTADAADFHI